MIARFVLILMCLASPLNAQLREKSYEAVIRGSTHVTVMAKSFYEAREKIKAIYCDGTDCIQEGPWETH